MSNRYLGGFVTDTPTQPTQSSAPGMWTLSQVSQAVGNSIWPTDQYQIGNSLRFRSSANAYLNRTPSVAGNRQTWTWSAWVKLGTLSVDRVLFSTPYSTAGGATGTYIQITVDNVLYFGSLTSSTYQILLNPKQVFRDPSSWYHIVVVADTNNATSTDRARIYVNGARITEFNTATYPSSGALTHVNSTVSHDISRVLTNGIPLQYFDGYMAEVNFIDGQALTPSYFGQISTTTGVWQPIRYSGTYGNNGFKLNFSNGTSTTTLGYDSSGNGNNWTTNNISLTAGSTYDWMIDSPTPFQGSSYGVGNYAVLNPLNSPSTTLSNANLSGSTSGSGWFTSPSTMAMRGSGKYYFEFTKTDTNAQVVGITPSTTSMSSFVGNDANGWGYYSVNGNLYNNAGASVAFGATYTNGDVIGVAFDAATGKLWFSKNNTWQASGDPANGTNPAATVSLAYSYVAGFSSNNTGALTVNFGQRPFSYTPPTGFKSLCTFNLPTPSIVNGASYMAATTYTGTGASLSVSGAAFQPDLVWIKSRSAATDNKLTDSVRGTTNALVSNSTAVATTDAGGVTAFNSNGFTVGTTAAYNTNAATYIGWQWKAGGTAITNTAGTITSQVSANTTAGFSVVTYTGTGANATVGHGLGVAPSMVITKKRSSTSDWGVYHSSLTSAAYYLLLDSAAAQASGATYWNSTAPTSSVFSIGTADPTNISTATYVAYCFAAIPGYSAFGSYTGNGSTDGPFVYCGFRPRFVLIKQITSGATNWLIKDTSRDPYNISSRTLQPNTANSEDTTDTWLDINSNGFKIRYGSVLAYNQNGIQYIYACFAENPFQNALAR